MIKVSNLGKRYTIRHNQPRRGGYRRFSEDLAGALTTIEAGNERNSDLDQVRYATQHGYSIVTYNVSDFPRLHHEILSSGGSHAGIIVATQDRPKANAKALLAMVSAFAAEDFVNQLIYLNN